MTVTLARPATHDTTVWLASDYDLRLSTGSVVIPTGSTSAQFTVTAHSGTEGYSHSDVFAYANGTGVTTTITILCNPATTECI